MEWWEDIYNRQISFDLYEEKEVQQVLTLLHPSGAAHILDLCCGYGRHSIPLARRGFQVTGVDLSAIQIQHAREVASKAHARLDFHVADARKLNCGRNSMGSLTGRNSILLSCSLCSTGGKSCIKWGYPNQMSL
jgi:2-polyprenyl-3-methyl-5-hydroxy-6-metoxy-1,4-benzoquinol methylase